VSTASLTTLAPLQRPLPPHVRSFQIPTTTPSGICLQGLRSACPADPTPDCSTILACAGNDVIIDLLVDAINVVLGLNSNAPVARDEFVLADNTLCVLKLALSVVPVARVEDNGVLVRRQLGLDATVCAR